MKIITSYQYEQGRLKSLFDQICDEKNWKNPIHCVIPSRAFNDYNEACVHFTGAGLTLKGDFDNKVDMIECTSPGYYGFIGA
jgi:hypothetical protein